MKAIRYTTDTTKNPSGLRFEEGSHVCGICKTKDNIIQFERATKRRGLPIVEIAFICRACAEKEKKKVK